MTVARKPSENELILLINNTYAPGKRREHVIDNGFFISKSYQRLRQEILNFEVFDTDLWICGFPKTGTTWASEMSWLMVHDMDYEGAKELDYKRTRLLEFSILIDSIETDALGAEEYLMDSLNFVKKQKHPRTIKSHLPFPLLPKQLIDGSKKPRIIYTARNPMDTCISYYHHMKNWEGFIGTLEEFSKLFVFDKVNYAPYADHVLRFWEKRHEPNILFLTYEEMKKDIRGSISRIAKLLGKTLTDQDVQRLQEHVSFDSMRNNPAVNKAGVTKMVETAIKEKTITPFIRSGKAGGYKNQMSSELIELFHIWIGKKFKASGLNLMDE